VPCARVFRNTQAGPKADELGFSMSQAMSIAGTDPCSCFVSAPSEATENKHAASPHEAMRGVSEPLNRKLAIPLTLAGMWLLACVGVFSSFIQTHGGLLASTVTLVGFSVFLAWLMPRWHKVFQR
jgi:hypothetical protein